MTEPSPDAAIYAIGLILFLGILSSRLTGRFGIPGLALFMGIGMLIGSDILGWVYFDDAEFARLAGALALIVILFEGGLKTDWRSIRGVIVPSAILATLGVVLTSGILGLLIHWLLGMELLHALLLASIVGSTDAAAVFAVIGSQRLVDRVKYTLEAESGLNDPMAILLTVTFLGILTGQEQSIGVAVALIIWQLVSGAAFGFLLGRLAAKVINKLSWEDGALYSVFTLSTAILTYTIVALLGGSGFMAVYIYGIVLGNSRITFKKSIVRFQDSLAWIGQILMFSMLGLLVFPRELPGVIVPGLAVAAILTFIARPLAVYLCIIGFRFNLREKLFLYWGGLRGSVPIVLATYPYVAGYEHSDWIFNTVFFVVLTSALLQGTTIPAAVRRLGLELPGEKTPQHSLEIHSPNLTDVEVVTIRVDEGSPAVGRTVAELGLPDKCVISAISRGDSLEAPRGHTVIQPDDFLFVLTPSELQAELRESLGGQHVVLSHTDLE